MDDHTADRLKGAAVSAGALFALVWGCNHVDVPPEQTTAGAAGGSGTAAAAAPAAPPSNGGSTASSGPPPVSLAGSGVPRPSSGPVDAGIAPDAGVPRDAVLAPVADAGAPHDGAAAPVPAAAAPQPAAPPGPDAGAAAAGLPHVFVIAMENTDATSVYGSADAPYINGVLLPAGASTANFIDELPGQPSEPHYIWMEAGTNTFADHMFVNDDPPSATNSTASPDHLVSEIRAAGGGRDWMTYQEGLDGAGCPIAGRGTFVPRHDPFLFFRDLVGEPPSASAPLCATHHRPLGQLNGDLASGGVASYVFITPDLCHDMHGSAACPAGNVVRLGDAWLSGVVPPLLAFVTERGGVVFIVWDEGDRTAALPFIALGPHVRPGYRSVVPFNHGSLVRSVERILSLPVLPTVQAVSDLGDLFEGGVMP